MDILIPTLMLWVVTSLVVEPLARNWTVKQLKLVPNTDMKDFSGEDKMRFEKVLTKKFILVDIAILGALGFVAGLLGYWFIGISLNKKGWPGMIAFILASFIGSAIKNGSV